MKRVVTAVLFGLLVWAFTLGALSQRAAAEAQNDPLPPVLVALALGAAFTVGRLPVAWSILGRIFLPVPTLFVYLTIFLEKQPPLPFYAAFALALCYAGALTILARQLADRPARPILGSRRNRLPGGPPARGVAAQQSSVGPADAPEAPGVAGLGRSG
jgi:hypothetical protein